MNLVDSCGWLEYFADGPNADFFTPVIEDTENVLVPSICILEVFKRIFQQRNEDSALQCAASMKQGRIVELDSFLAIKAAKIGHELGLPLANSVILATAHAYNAVIWTQDSDFKNIKGVKYIQK